MKNFRGALVAGFAGGVVAAFLLGVYSARAGEEQGKAAVAAAVPAAGNAVELGELQLKSINVTTAATHAFVAESRTVGYIDFNQDRSTPVYAPAQGIIKDVFATASEDVRMGQALFSLESPDLLQAESTLVAAAGALERSNKALERARRMLDGEAGAQKDVEQAVADQQAAEAAWKAARNAVRLLGLSDAETDRVVAERRVDGLVRIAAPIAGRVIARNIAPGQLVQAAAAPAPFAIADISTLWMMAQVAESDLPALKKGQPVDVSVDAYPGRVFHGTVDAIGVGLDPGTHRLAVRSVIRDPQHELHPQMLATFAIRTGAPQQQVAAPKAAVVRGSDGASAVFITTDGRRFERRTVQLGEEQDGLYPVLAGLKAGERIATEGALFLDNALALQAD